MSDDPATAARIDVLRRVMQTPRWALFENGTIVFVADPDADVAARALDVIAEFGPVHAGSAAGDFSVIVLPDALGWVVTSHHPDLLTLVLSTELDASSKDLAVGLWGRSMRDADAHHPVIVHVEGA